MFKESGNLLKEELEISKEFLDHCNRNHIKIDLKTGDYSATIKPQRGKAFIKELVTQIHQLYLSGNLHPYDYFEALCCKNSNKVIEMFQRAGLRILTKEEKQEIYGDRDEEIKQEAFERMRRTNFERYGAEQVFESAEIKAKIKQTMIERHGVDNPLKSQEIRDKGTQTMLERHGVDHAFKMDKSKKAREKSVREKYGVRTPLESKEIQEKIEVTNLERYGVRRPLQNKEILKSTFSEEAMGKRFTSIASRDPRFKRLREISEITKARKLNDAEIAEAFELCFTFSPDRRKVVLRELGLLGKNEFSTEKKVKVFLESLGVEFIQNAKKAHGVKRTKESVQYYDADFLIPNLNLVIEVNGLAYHSTNKATNGKPKEIEYHFNKFRAFHNAGYQMISFTDYELKNMWPSVTEIIKFHLGLLETLSESTKVEYQGFLGYPIEESLNYNFFDKNNLNFENESLPATAFIVPRMLDGWEYWDCGKVGRVDRNLRLLE